MLIASYSKVDVKPGDKSPVAKVIGFSWCPILKLSKVQTGDFALPVATELPAAYLRVSYRILKLCDPLTMRMCVLCVCVEPGCREQGCQVA